MSTLQATVFKKQEKDPETSHKSLTHFSPLYKNAHPE